MWCLKCDGCGTTRSIGSLSEMSDVASGWVLDRNTDHDLCPACKAPATVINCKVGGMSIASPHQSADGPPPG